MVLILLKARCHDKSFIGFDTKSSITFDDFQISKYNTQKILKNKVDKLKISKQLINKFLFQKSVYSKKFKKKS